MSAVLRQLKIVHSRSEVVVLCSSCSRRKKTVKYVITVDVNFIEIRWHIVNGGTLVSKCGNVTQPRRTLRRKQEAQLSQRDLRRFVSLNILLSHSSHDRVARFSTRPAGRAGSGRIRQFTGKGEQGRVQFGQKLKFNFTFKYTLVSVFYFAFQFVQCSSCIFNISCSFQCILGDVTDGEFLSAVASRWHDYLLFAASAVEMPPSMLSSVTLFHSMLGSGRRAAAVCIPLLAQMPSHEDVSAPKLDYHDSL